MAYLIITSGQQTGKYFRLGKRTLAGGRDPAREIQIIDPKVSRKHFLIRQDGDHHVIVETKTKNGLLVNDQPCTEKTLRYGDTIQVGQTTMTYHAGQLPDRTNALEQFRKGDRELREDRTITDE